MLNPSHLTEGLPFSGHRVIGIDADLAIPIRYKPSKEVHGLNIEIELVIIPRFCAFLNRLNFAFHPGPDPKK